MTVAVAPIGAWPGQVISVSRCGRAVRVTVAAPRQVFHLLGTALVASHPWTAAVCGWLWRALHALGVMR